MSEISNTIKSGVNQFKDSLSNSKSFKKFKKRATKFGETGKFNIKDFASLGEPLMKDFKKHGKSAALSTLKNLTTQLEGNRTKYKGVGLSGSGNKKDMSKGPNEKAPIDYRWIQAKGNTKKEVLSASYNHYNWRDSFTPTEIESFDIIKPEPLVKEGVAGAVLKVPGVKKTIAKVGGAVLAAKGGEKILKDLLGTPGKPKATDWDKNPKDKIDQELNVRQGQAKDAAKNKDFDTDMKSYRKGKDNISDEDKIQRLKDAAKKHRKYKPKFNPRQNMTDKQVERMRKAGLL